MGVIIIPSSGVNPGVYAGVAVGVLVLCICIKLARSSNRRSDQDSEPAEQAPPPSQMYQPSTAQVPGHRGPLTDHELEQIAVQHGFQAASDAMDRQEMMEQQQKGAGGSANVRMPEPVYYSNPADAPPKYEEAPAPAPASAPATATPVNHTIIAMPSPYVPASTAPARNPTP
ncbi:hypothetical protein GQ42DRAFT_164884 [Ramicandelaber brevisporus]|nr:hypothetical protein GQ42DRAFT_164884 [Ramicandelaber brevisporus]